VIGTTVARLRRAFPDAEVIVADDGSRDPHCRSGGRSGRRRPAPATSRQGPGLVGCERAAPPGALLLSDADLSGELDAL